MEGDLKAATAKIAQLQEFALEFARTHKNQLKRLEDNHEVVVS